MFSLYQRSISFLQLRRIASTVKEVNLYDILEITPKASQSQIKKAFYKLSKAYHPDINNSKEAKEKYVKIVEAYEILGNLDQRKQYDDRFATYTAKEITQDVDPSYRQFYRHRGTFKARPNAPMRGRTHYYNFDEFYKEHYGRNIRENFNRKRKEEENKKEFEKWGQTNKKLVSLYFIGLPLTLLIFLNLPD